MLYGCVTQSLCAGHYDTLRRAHDGFLTLCIGWRKNNRTDHPMFYLGSLMTGSESIEAIKLKRRILFLAGFVVRLEDTRLPKCVMFGELVGRGVGRKKSGWGVSCMTFELSVSTPTSGRLQPRTRGEWRKTAEQGAERFMAKWIAAEKARAGLRHAVVCPNVTGRTKGRIAQSNRVRAGSLAIVD